MAGWCFFWRLPVCRFCCSLLTFCDFCKEKDGVIRTFFS